MHTGYVGGRCVRREYGLTAYVIYFIVTFFACGFSSFQEAFDSSRAWGRKRKAEIEGWSGMDFSKNDPDKIAIKSMSEEEEMEYIQRKYLSDEIMKKDSNSNLTKWIKWLGWQSS